MSHVVFLVLRNCYTFPNGIKMPSLTIALTEQNKYSKDNALSILNKIELTSLKDITKSMRIFYDPNDYSTNVEEDRELLQIYKVFTTLTL